MSKLVNASPEEIREYFKGHGVRWVETFNNNNVPDEIIMEFKDRIFRGDSFSRADAIINMMVANNRQMPKELFDIIDAKFGSTRFYHIDKVYDFVGYLMGLPVEQVARQSYHACTTLERVPNVPLEFVEMVLGLESDSRMKHDAVDKMLSTPEHPILPEVYDYLVEYLKTHYHPYYLNARSYEAGNIEVQLFTVEEYISLVSPHRIISFFDYGHVLFDSESILKSAYNTPTVIQLVVDKINEMIDDGKARPLSNRDWIITKTLIKDHPDFEKIRDAFTSQRELYSRNELVWDDVDKHIESGKMESEVLEAVLLRLDAPLWFTDKYQSKILQIMTRFQMENNVHNNVLESFGRAFNHLHEPLDPWNVIRPY